MKMGSSYDSLDCGKETGGIKSGHNDKGTPVKGSFEIDGPMGVGTVGGDGSAKQKPGPIQKYKG